MPYQPLRQDPKHGEQADIQHDHQSTADKNRSWPPEIDHRVNVPDSIGKPQLPIAANPPAVSIPPQPDAIHGSSRRRERKTECVKGEIF